MVPARVDTYSGEHAVLIVIFLGGCVAAGIIGRRLRDHEREPAFRRGFALLIPVFTVPLQVTLLLPGAFDLDTSLPLQLCDLSWMLATWALFTRHRRAAQVLYYWGLVLTSQAILTPDLVQAFPHPTYIMFWGMHFLAIWAACYLTFGLGIRPDWAGFRLAVLVTAAWAGLVMVFNALADTNYGYLNRKPQVASVLDLFGPWPLYVVVESILVILVWAAITWPWVRSRAQAQEGLPGTGADLDRGDR